MLQLTINYEIMDCNYVPSMIRTMDTRMCAENDERERERVNVKESSKQEKSQIMRIISLILSSLVEGKH